MTKQYVLIGTRMFFGLLTLAALGSQLMVQIQSGFSLINFFSYFTNLSNLFAAVVMIFVAINSLRVPRSRPLHDSLRGASVVGMAVVGIVFNLLLRNVDLGGLLLWVNVVIHYVMPVAAVLDWLVDPPRSKLTLRRIAYWLIFPLCYLAYSIVRGAIVGFYAYPFFSPDQVGGYGGVGLYCIAIFVLFLIVSWLLLKLGNRFQQNL